MTQAHSTLSASPVGEKGSTSVEPAPLFAALDLGTNNCRLLIASPNRGGFRVVEAFSRIVRLGEGLSLTGRLDDAAQERAIAALRICADKLRRRKPQKVLAVATQACRFASNGEAFVARVEAETGLKLRIISPKEEAQLSVAGCLALLDRQAHAALVVDVGGGSTELSWVDLTDARMDQVFRLSPDRLPIQSWISLPLGVVTLAERFPEGERGDAVWFRSITSLAGMHLGLARYDRSRVDGLWLTRTDCENAAGTLLGLTADERAAQPCIGPDRADLVLAGAAILQGVQELWPCERVRVADRGLREGLLLSLIQKGKTRRRRRRKPRSI